MSETSMAVHNGVMAWMEMHTPEIMEIFRKAGDSGIELLTAGIMSKVGGFLDANRSDLIAAIAAAVAASYHNRHPMSDGSIFTE